MSTDDRGDAQRRRREQGDRVDFDLTAPHDAPGRPGSGGDRDTADRDRSDTGDGDQADSGIIDFADPEPTSVGATTCPECGLIVRGDSEVCYRCSASILTATPADRKRALAQSRPCGKCGYEMRGLPHGKCPECGAVVPRGRARRQAINAAEEYRSELRRPLIIGCVVAVICLVWSALWLGWRGPVDFSIFSAINLGLAVGAAFVLSHFAIDLDDPWSLTTVRLFAAQTITDLSLLILATTCAPALFLAAIIYIIAIAMLTGLELVESFILGITIVGVRIGVMIALFTIF